MKNIDLLLCSGCLACIQVCKHKALTAEADKEGFLYPIIDSSKCVECGLCYKVCPYREDTPIVDEKFSKIIYAAYNKNEDIRLKSSSGGIFYGLVELIIQKKGIVFGVRFDDHFKVVHSYAETIQEAQAFLGSKYVQSDIGDSFQRVKEFLDGGRWVLFSGTPCQVKGLLLFLRKPYSNLLTVDIICHGVPSPRLWNLYVDEISSVENQRLETVGFRNKSNGWAKFNFALGYLDDLNCKNIKEEVWFNISDWGRSFISDLTFRYSCYNCTAKNFKSGSDITIGDFWGINNVIPWFNDDKGCSVVFVNTCIGNNVFQSLDCENTVIDLPSVIASNKALVEPVEMPKERSLFYKYCFEAGSLKQTMDNFRPQHQSSMVKHNVLKIFPFMKKAKSVMRKCKGFLSEILDFVLSSILVNFIKRDTDSKSILLIPADNLNGGFGEDIMVSGFISQFSDSEIIILSGEKINRQYLSHYNVKLVDGIDQSLSYTKILSILKVCSDVYVIGADIMDGVYKNGTYRFRVLDLAHRMGLNTHITGISIRESIDGEYKNKFKYCSNHTLLKARDIDSYNRFLSFVDDNRCCLTADIAFLALNPTLDSSNSEYDCCVKWVDKERTQNRKIVAFCPNTIQAQKLGLDVYLNNMQLLINEFLEEGCSILFLYHDLRKYALNTNDKELSRMLFFKTQNIHTQFVYGIDDGIYLKAYLKLADFTVSGRMHFGISGYTLGIPMFGICYYNKFEGLQSSFGIDLENSLVEYTDVENSIGKVSLFIENIERYKQKVVENIQGVQAVAKKNIL